MCSTRQILSPSGSLFNKNSKYVDPLGVTKTAVGDPTGRIRREQARVDRENAPRKHLTNVKYRSLPQQQTVLGGGWGL